MTEEELEVVDVLAQGAAALRSEFEAYRLSIARSEDARLHRNYGPDAFRLADQLAVLVLCERASRRILGFSSVYRPPHWPEGLIRVGNRSWLDLAARGGRLGASGGAAASVIAYCRMVARATSEAVIRNGGRLAVITREAGTGSNAMERLARQLVTLDYAWTPMTSGYYLTVAGGTSRSCWQKLIYTEFSEGARRLLSEVPRITDDVYAARYGEPSTPRFL